jgi:hypothetical protein
VRVHNEKEKWDEVTPQLGNHDVIALGRAVKNMALGGAGLPEAWFAEGDSANRATLAAQGDPTYRMLQSRQKHVRAMVERLLTVVFQEQTGKRLAEARDPDTGLPKLPEFKVTMPDISSKDTSTISTAMPQVANALATAVAETWLDTKTARSVFIAVTQQLGVDLDPAAIEKAVEAEQEAKAAEEERRREELGQVADDLDALAGGPQPMDPTAAKLAGQAAHLRTQGGGAK